MKKTLLSLLAIFFATSMNAQTEVTFDFDNDATALFGIEGRSSGSGDSYVADGEFNEDATAVVDGVSLTVEASAADATTRNRLWATKPVLRMYNGTLTVSAPGHNITKMKFTSSKFDNGNTFSTGQYESLAWTATEATSTVVLTVVKNTQLNKLVVTLDGDDTPEPPVEIDGTGEGTVESPYDVARAISLIKNAKASSSAVYVKGTISSVKEVSMQYGNATYNISDDGTETEGKVLTVFRGKNLNNGSFASEDEIQDGDEVVVCGKLIDYNGTPEMAQGNYIYSLNGKTWENNYEAVGDGSKENPYTVADIQGLQIKESDGQKYWVKGVILGCAASAAKLAEGDAIGDTNIALGATADATTFVPVAIPAGDLRAVLGVATNPGNVGKEVMVCGTLEAYFSTAGVKNVTEAVIDGKEYSTGIEAVQNAECRMQKAYNLAGQRVSDNFRGIVIQGGKKLLVK